MRKSKLAGMYFEFAPTLLNKQIEEAYKDARGPGDLPAKPNNHTHIKGIITPKYEYKVSAPCSAWAYKQIAEHKIPDVFIIIGHTKTQSGIGMEPYETPYGIVRTDQGLAREIIKKGTIKENNEIFNEDEYIESQLPHIQFLYRTQLEKIKIIPILVGHDIELKKLAVDIKETLLELDKNATIITPTNFTSYGALHKYIPFEENAHKKVYEQDAKAIDLITENKPIEYLDFVDKHATNTDNYLGITLLMLILKPRKSLLEQYYTTADINKDYKNFISFASIVFK